MATKNSTFKPWNKNKQQSVQQDNDETEEHYISKSQAKREVEALQKLGLKLVELPKSTLQTFALDEKLFDAVLLAKTIRSHSGHRRQIQLIGKLMRQVDAKAIQQKLEQHHKPIIQANAHFHMLENWRDRILNEGDSAINELLLQYSHFERSKLRQLLRNAKKEIENNKPPKSARQLFKYLKENISE